MVFLCVSADVIIVTCVVFFNETATTEIYTYGHTLSLHDSLPISRRRRGPSAPSGRTRCPHRSARRPRPARARAAPARRRWPRPAVQAPAGRLPVPARSEEHTSELQSLMRISYAVFCLKKKIKPIVSTNLSSLYHHQTTYTT